MEQPRIKLEGNLDRIAFAQNPIRKRKLERSSSDSSLSVSTSTPSKGRKKAKKRKHKHSRSSTDSSLSSMDRKKAKKRKHKHSRSSSSFTDNSSSSRERKKKKKHKHRQREEGQPKNAAVIGPQLLLATITAKGEKVSKSKAMRPMTKEEWEKQQSVVRRIYDPETGRNRLVKGDGEVLEEIVNKEQHREINKQATRGDGLYFQTQMGIRDKQ